MLLAQNTTQTLIGGELKTTPAFINVSLADVAEWINWQRVWHWADLSLDISLVISCSPLNCSIYMYTYRKNVTAWVINLLLDSELATTFVNSVLAWFQPPTAKRIFSFGLVLLRAFNSATNAVITSWSALSIRWGNNIIGNATFQLAEIFQFLLILYFEIWNSSYRLGVVHT